MPARLPRFALIALSLLLAASCREDPEAAARRHYEKGLAYAEEGRKPEAIIELRNAVQKHPRYGEAYYALADLYATSGEPENAGKAFVRAAEFLPDRPDVQLRVGGLMLNDGEFEWARMRAEHVLQRDPDNVDALILQASAMAGLRQIDQAVADVEEALRNQPQDARLQTHLGNLQMVKGLSPEAEAALRRALALDPRAVAPHLSLGNFYWASGRQADAEREFLATLELEPDNAIANRALATLYMASNRGAEAERHLSTWARNDPVGGQLALADFYAGAQRHDEARKAYEAITAPEAAALAASRLAALDVATGAPDAAEQRLLAALKKQPRSDVLLLPLAQRLLETGRVTEARERLDVLLAAHPNSAPGWMLIGRLAHAEGRAAQAEKAYRQAVRLNPRLLDAHLGLFALAETAGDAELAVQHAREALSAWPGHPLARLALSRAYTLRGNFADARLEATAALEGRPGWLPARLQLGTIALREGRTAEARRVFEAVKASAPDNIEAFAGLVRVALAEGRTEAAAALVSGRQKLNPDHPMVLTMAAAVAQARGDAEGATRALERIVEVAPDNYAAYEMLGRLQATRGQHAEARATFEALAQRHPRPAGALTLVGTTYEAEGRLDEARRQYEKALEADPNAGGAANNLAWLLAQNDDTLADALGYATTAQRVLPRQPEVLDTLGWVHYRQGASRVAVSWFERAVQANPQEPLYRYHLALALHRDGRHREARAALESALSGGRAFAGEAEARRLLASLPEEPAAAPRAKR